MGSSKHEYVTKRFFITFGQKSPFSNGWVEIQVQNVRDNDEEADKKAYLKARSEAFHALGDGWSNIYDETAFSKSRQNYFPDGRIGRILKIN